MSISFLRAPTKNLVASIRSDLNALGIKANIRQFTHSIRIVLPEFTTEAAAKVKSYAEGKGLKLSGNSTDWTFAWGVHQGRGQVFLYDIRKD